MRATRWRAISLPFLGGIGNAPVLPSPSGSGRAGLPVSERVQGEVSPTPPVKWLREALPALGDRPSKGVSEGRKGTGWDPDRLWSLSVVDRGKLKLNGCIVVKCKRRKLVCLSSGRNRPAGLPAADKMSPKRLCCANGWVSRGYHCGPSSGERADPKSTKAITGKRGKPPNVLAFILDARGCQSRVVRAMPDKWVAGIGREANAVCVTHRIC